jgi:hypothetical protein
MDTFESIHTYLLSYPAPLLPPSKPISTSLTPKIAGILLHPTLEAALHILNLDLPSAHFLVRHMQSPPAYEGMYLHGILHRIEGDFDNARAWYSDAKHADVYSGLWGKGGKGWKEWKDTGGNKDEGQVFLDEIQKLKDRSDSGKDSLEELSRREIEHVICHCVRKFGTKKIEDASDAWVNHSKEIRQMGEDQVSGDASRRTF